MEKIIEVKGLSKSYGPVKAVKGIDFYVEKGSLFAFLGPNGAGKSTTIDMLCTFLEPDGGSAVVNGYELGKEDDKIRRSIGTVFQDGVLDGLLTVEENLKMRGSLYELKGAALSEAVKKAAYSSGVSDLLKRRYGKLSGGQRRRADIARALVNTPKILILDEPTTGLDPQTRKSVWNTVRSLQRETGMTVFLTTHYMEEAAEADYVVVIDDGLIAAKGTPAELKEKYASDTMRLSYTDLGKITKILEAEDIKYSLAGQEIVVKLNKTVDALPIAEKCKSYVSNIEILNGTMDDAFIGITGKELRE